MSTDYEIVCHKHKEKADICTDGMSGPMLNCDNSLSAFCITHERCDLNIITEHDDSCENYRCWTKENWKGLLNYGIEV